MLTNFLRMVRMSIQHLAATVFIMPYPFVLNFLPRAERAALDRQVMCLFLIQLHASTYMTCMILSFTPTIGPGHSSTHRLISGTSGAHPKWSPDLRWPMKVRATSPSHPARHLQKPNYRGSNQKVVQDHRAKGHVCFPV